MVQTNISLNEREHHKLKLKAEAEGISMSEVIRRATNYYIPDSQYDAWINPPPPVIIEAVEPPIHPLLRDDSQIDLPNRVDWAARLKVVWTKIRGIFTHS